MLELRAVAVSIVILERKRSDFNDNILAENHPPWFWPHFTFNQSWSMTIVYSLPQLFFFLLINNFAFDHIFHQIIYSSQKKNKQI